MDDIKELIHIISKRKLSQIDIFDKSLISHKNTLFSKLYDGISSGTINTDYEAIQYLYSTGIDEPSEQNKLAYRRLKSRFKHRLYNTLYFLDINQTSFADIAKKEYAYCINNLYLSNLLLRYADSRSASINLVKEAYAVAYKNNFYDILKEFSFKLLVTYGMEGNSKKYHEELLRYERYKNEFNLEQNAQIIYSKIYLLSNMKKYDPYKLEAEMKAEIEKIVPLYKESTSINTYYSYIRSKLFMFEKIGDKENMISVCSEFLKDYKKYKTSMLLPNYTDIISLHKLKLLFDMRDYRNCIELYTQLISNTKSLNWLSINELYFKTQLNKQIDEKVLTIVSNVMANSHYKAASSAIKERWLLYQAYATLLNQYSHQIDFKINISKLANQLIVLSGDKSGFNATFRILEIFYAIALNDLDTAADKINLLVGYQKRHIKNEKYQRFFLFQQLLVHADTRGFNYKELRDLKPYIILRDNYKQHSINDNEIIFYDKLWEIILDILRINDNKLLKKLLP